MDNHDRLILLFNECKEFETTLTLDYFRRALFALKEGNDDEVKKERVYIKMSEKTAQSLVKTQFLDIRISLWLYQRDYVPPPDVYKGITGLGNQAGQNSFFALWKDHNNFYPIIIDNLFDYGKVQLVGR